MFDFPSSPVENAEYTSGGQTFVYKAPTWMLKGGSGVPEAPIDGLQYARSDAAWETVAAGREVLTAARTYYVRTDGNDSNDGLADTSGRAFLTLQKAWNTICGLDLCGFIPTIKVADGTYTAGVTGLRQPFNSMGNNQVWITGNTSTPATCIINTAAAGNCFYFQNAATLYIQGFTLTSSSGNMVSIRNYCHATFLSVNFTSGGGSLSLYLLMGLRMLHCKAPSMLLDLLVALSTHKTVHI